MLHPRCCFEWIMHASVDGWFAGVFPGLRENAPQGLVECRGYLTRGLTPPSQEGY